MMLLLYICVIYHIEPASKLVMAFSSAPAGGAVANILTSHFATEATEQV